MLLKLAVPDTLILLIAFSAGVVAALGQAAIPYFIGRYLWPAVMAMRALLQSTPLNEARICMSDTSSTRLSNMLRQGHRFCINRSRGGQVPC